MAPLLYCTLRQEQAKVYPAAVTRRLGDFYSTSMCALVTLIYSHTITSVCLFVRSGYKNPVTRDGRFTGLLLCDKTRIIITKTCYSYWQWEQSRLRLAAIVLIARQLCKLTVMRYCHIPRICACNYLITFHRLQWNTRNWFLYKNNQHFGGHEPTKLAVV